MKTLCKWWHIVRLIVAVRRSRLHVTTLQSFNVDGPEVLAPALLIHGRLLATLAIESSADGFFVEAERCLVHAEKLTDAAQGWPIGCLICNDLARIMAATGRRNLAEHYTRKARKIAKRLYRSKFASAWEWTAMSSSSLAIIAIGEANAESK